MNIRERRHRLSLNLYKGKVRATFTLCVEGRKGLFVEKAVVDRFLNALVESKNRYNCVNWLYIFMPDHLHLILEGKSEGSDLWKTIVLFKQKTGFWLSKNRVGVKWQKDFYDHIHRRDDNLKQHIRYILDNPVRKGLVDNWRDYRFKGSMGFDLERIMM